MDAQALFESANYFIAALGRLISGPQVPCSRFRQTRGRERSP
jgi:hypothetical protein